MLTLNCIDGVLLRALLDACAHCGRPDIAERAFVAARRINPHFKFSQFEYGLLIKCYSSQRDLGNLWRCEEKFV